MSKHFSLDELTRSDTAARYGISNEPSAEEIEKLEWFAETILEPIREKFGPYRPNSVYRCPFLNTVLKGSRNSQHMKCEAGDVEVPTATNYELAAWIEKNLIFDQLILECYTPGKPRSGWVHVSRVKDLRLNRREVLTYSGGKYLRGLIA